MISMEITKDMSEENKQSVRLLNEWKQKMDEIFPDKNN